jgi:hypothetical protein
MTDRVLVEIFVAAPIDTVRNAVRDPGEVQRWFGWDYPNLAADVDMMFGGLIADETNRTLSAEGMRDRFTFESAGGGTIVRVIRSAPVTDESWTGVYSEEMEGWLTFLQQLKFALERHPGGRRRTIFLNGRAASAQTGLPLEALGLSGLAIVPPGERYTMTAANGERLEGTVWHRGSYQIAVTVDGYGDGLIVLRARPRTAKSQHGGGNIVITTYGLDDAAYAKVHERWTRWWQDTYEVIEIQPAALTTTSTPR